VKLRKSRKLISILLTLSFLACMLVPMAGVAGAATVYSTASTPTIKADNTISQDLGTVLVDWSYLEGAGKVHSVVIKLSSKYKFDWAAGQEPSAALVKDDDSVLGAAGTAFTVTGGEVVRLSDREFRLDLTTTAAAAGSDVQVAIYLPNVTAENDATGDVIADFTAISGQFTSDDVVVGKVSGGACTVTAGDSLTLTGAGTTGGAVEITVKEDVAGGVDLGTDTLKFKLPKGFAWDLTSFAITNVATGAAIPAATMDVDATASSGERTLCIDRFLLGGLGKTTFRIYADVTVDEEVANFGDVDVTISGKSNVSPSSINIGTYSDYGYTIEVDDPTEVKAGRNAEEIADITIKEDVAGSILNGRTIMMTLPDGCEWNAPAGINVKTDKGTLTTTFAPVAGEPNKAKGTVTNGAAKGTMTIDSAEIDVAVNFTGDITVEFSGSAGITETVTVAKAIAPVTASAVSSDIKIGIQNQSAGNITITEGEAEALINGQNLNLTAPAGVEWSKVPTVKVTSGDLEIGTVTRATVITNNDRLVIPIRAQSAVASTIEITDIVFTTDRTVPEGDVIVRIGGPAVDEAGITNRTTAASVVPANCITPAPGETKQSSTFVIGSTTYTIGGVEQTMDVAPYIKGDRTYMPLRYVAYAAGVSDANIMWNAADQSVVLIKGDRVVKLTIGNTNMLINGVTFTMDVAPEIVDPGRTMLPIRWVAQALGCNVDWDEATQTVTVN